MSVLLIQKESGLNVEIKNISGSNLQNIYIILIKDIFSSLQSLVHILKMFEIKEIRWIPGLLPFPAIIPSRLLKRWAYSIHNSNSENRVGAIVGDIH